MTQEEELEEQNKSPNILLYPRSPVNLHINLPSPPPFSCRPPSPSVSIDCRQRIYYSIYNQRPTTKHNGDDSCQGGGMKHIPWTTTTSDAMRDDTPGRVDCRDRRLNTGLGWVLGIELWALSSESEGLRRLWLLLLSLSALLYLGSIIIISFIESRGVVNWMMAKIVVIIIIIVWWW